MKTTRNEVSVDRSHQKALINHFIRELFGDGAIKKSVQQYPHDEYFRVLQTFLEEDYCCLATTRGRLPWTEYDRDILLSFLKHYALNFLGNNEIISIKDHLANDLCVSAIRNVVSSMSLE